MGFIRAFFTLMRALFRTRAALAVENLALRQQLAVLRRSAKRPKLRRRDQVFWIWLSKVWVGWRSVLLIVKPETVIRWHQQGFRLFWRWRSRKCKCGRALVDVEIRDLIRQMSQENPSWGASRIQSELLLLGYDVAESTVAKYMIRKRKPPSQTWRTFLDNHIGDIAAIDFFTVPTVTFRILFCFFVLLHDRRRVVYFNVTLNPSPRWTAQQMIEAFPFDEAPKYLLRDRDSIYAEYFIRRVKEMGMKEVKIAPQSPWQNPYAERLIGSIRRECLDHVIVLCEAHLRNILRMYLGYYHEDRPHLSLERNAPLKRKIESGGEVISMPRVGGLHHRYTRVA